MHCTFPATTAIELFPANQREISASVGRLSRYKLHLTSGAFSAVTGMQEALYLSLKSFATYSVVMAGLPVEPRGNFPLRLVKRHGRYVLKSQSP